jgi:tetratricopeptide (TPR) repeat protein
MLAALGGYAVLSGVLTEGASAPATVTEQALASSAAELAADPTNGSAYARRAEALFVTGDEASAFAILAQGEKAVEGKNPALLYVLRSWTAMLNRQHRYAEAEKVGMRGMEASDAYLEAQGVVLVRKGISVLGGNTITRPSVDTALALAEAYMGEKKYDKAIELYQYALSLEPLAADIHTMRGWAYLEKGDKAKAKADFTEAAKFLPDDAGVRAGLKAVAQ